MTEETKTPASQESLAAELVSKGVLTSDWLSAFQACPRDKFLPDGIWPGRAGMNRQTDRVLRTRDPDLWSQAVWSDAPITVQWDSGMYDGDRRGRTPTSSSSMPTMVFSMLHDLDVKPGHRVLEIGTGTGWNTALLCHRLGDQNVFTVELDPELAQGARGRLYKCDFAPYIAIGDGTNGYGKMSPYDRIIATCSVGEIPSQWIGQAKPGAVIVAPWGPGYGGEGIARLTVDESGIAQGHLTRSSAFMRISRQRKRFPQIADRLCGQEWPADASMDITELSPDDVGDWIHMFAIGVQVPDLFCHVEYGEDGWYRLWLGDADGASWATADYAPAQDRYAVAQCGPRRLWHELEASWRWWDEQGRPGFERFGLTTTGGPHFTVWLDSPDSPVPRRGKNEA
ncbi:methyltransferase domain-containing protein [Streptomyces beihaiensis]|uniref:Protein-L-isoaspartate O-methyltransferase n=1 Tax=Streptomyces beihaiensis TaxID=2984495 RepID=A0ABT3TQP0_9ACTN|nr:protein-L-isoaspartate(D-aspartate) O-methyltransferase [Streptomyces beihaiensis]MCX3059331.1 protein-L-isoaspartate(D-aspartate) O-methyltransferase [Streptomyces beihaiensis]